MPNPRKMSKEAYEKHVSENPNAISYLNTDAALIEWEDDNAFVMRVPDKFQYLEYEEYKVLDHFLIIPKDEQIVRYRNLRENELRSIRDARYWLEDRFHNSNYVIKESSLSLRSQEVFHIHFIVLNSLPNNEASRPNH